MRKIAAAAAVILSMALTSAPASAQLPSDTCVALGPGPATHCRIVVPAGSYGASFAAAGVWRIVIAIDDVEGSFDSTSGAVQAGIPGIFGPGFVIDAYVEAGTVLLYSHPY